MYFYNLNSFIRDIFFLFYSLTCHSALYRASFHVQWCVRMKYLPSSILDFMYYDLHSCVYHQISYYPENIYSGGSEPCVFIDYVGHRYIFRYIKFALYSSHNLFSWLSFLIILDTCIHEFILGKILIPLSHYLFISLCIWALYIILNISLWCFYSFLK